MIYTHLKNAFAERPNDFRELSTSSDSSHYSTAEEPWRLRLFRSQERGDFPEQSSGLRGEYS